MSIAARPHQDRRNELKFTMIPVLMDKAVISPIVDWLVDRKHLTEGGHFIRDPKAVVQHERLMGIVNITFISREEAMLFKLSFC